MSREEMLYFIINQLNDWALFGNEIRDELVERLISSSLIPKPKYRKGDIVKDTLNTPPNVYEIVFRSYDPDLDKWYYSPEDYINLSYAEDELELVEAAR